MGEIDLFDGHCDTLSACCQRGEGFWENSGQLDLKRTRGFGRYTQFFAVFGDTHELTISPDRHFRAEYALFQRELEENSAYIVQCRTGGQIEAAVRAGRTAAILSVEGAELLGCELGALEEAHRLGVRAINLTWNHANLLSGSIAEEPTRGLSPRGKAFVRRMEALGILVDVSHLSEPGFWDVAAMARKPFFASHSNARTVFPAQRNLTDAQFTAIIEHQGVAGLNMFRDFLGDRPGLDTIIAHLEHFLALGGEKNVCIGGDWDGIPVPPDGIVGVWDMEKLYERLLQRNYHEALLRDVFYENLMRVVNEVCTM